jgi:putative ABC transport system permease protein
VNRLRLASIVVFTLVTVAAASEEGVVKEVLISRQLFKRAGLHIGEIVTLSADPSPRGTRSARFKVVGVYEPTPDPMKFNVERLEARLHLDELIALTADPADPTSTESVTAVNLALVDPGDAPRLRSELTARMPGLIVSSTASGGSSGEDGGGTFVVLDRFHLAIAVVTVVGSAAFLLALMVIRAEERRETVGILRLIGISRRFILLEVVIEGLLVALGGAVFGVLVAIAAQYGVNRFFQARYDTPLVFVRVTPSIVIRSVAVALPIGVIAGAVASWTLLRRGAAALVRR